MNSYFSWRKGREGSTYNKICNSDGGHQGAIGGTIVGASGSAVKDHDFEELVLVLDKCKYMMSPSVKNNVTTFKYL